jgi:hypothetical protein
MLHKNGLGFKEETKRNNFIFSIYKNILNT